MYFLTISYICDIYLYVLILQAVEINSKRAFSESNIGGWDYLRNMVQLPFYLQNSALRRVKTAQQTAAKRLLASAADDFSTSLQRSVSSLTPSRLHNIYEEIVTYIFLTLLLKEFSLTALIIIQSVIECTVQF